MRFGGEIWGLGVDISFFVAEKNIAPRLLKQCGCPYKFGKGKTKLASIVNDTSLNGNTNPQRGGLGSRMRNKFSLTTFTLGATRMPKPIYH